MRPGHAKRRKQRKGRWHALITLKAAPPARCPVPRPPPTRRSPSRAQPCHCRHRGVLPATERCTAAAGARHDRQGVARKRQELRLQAETGAERERARAQLEQEDKKERAGPAVLLFIGHMHTEQNIMVLVCTAYDLKPFAVGGSSRGGSTTAMCALSWWAGARLKKRPFRTQWRAASGTPQAPGHELIWGKRRRGRPTPPAGPPEPMDQRSATQRA